MHYGIFGREFPCMASFPKIRVPRNRAFREFPTADHSFGLVDDDLLTLLFVIVYRYHQTREEVWRNGRLIA